MEVTFPCVVGTQCSEGSQLNAAVGALEMERVSLIFCNFI